MSDTSDSEESSNSDNNIELDQKTSKSAKKSNHNLIENKQNDDSDEERLGIRAELSKMSFEELQKLKESIGSKLYHQTIFKQPGKIKKRPHEHVKRENRNRPREMSSKKQVPLLGLECVSITKNEPRDPRFDSLCGTFDRKEFKHRYRFLSDVRTKECKSLKEELKNTDDPERVKKIKYLIQRMENQDREERLLRERNMKKHAEKQEYIEKLKRGEKPVYKSKSEKRVLDLVDRYEELKSKGKLKKHLEKHRKKNLQKDRKKMPHLS